MPTAVLFAPPPPPGTTAPLIAGGLTPLDRQRRQVRGAGLTRVLVVGDRALDVATLNDDVLVIDAGVVLDDRIVGAMAAATAPAVATWPAGAAGTERIDMHACAAGIALYPAALVRDTAATLGDWDLGPTLLRAALAAGATRVDLAALPTFDAGLRRAVPLTWARPDDADAAALATDALLAAARPGSRDWVGRWLHAPVEDAVVRAVLPTRIPADPVAAMGVAVAVGAGIALATGWLWAGLLLALLCGPLAGVAAAVARVRVEHPRIGGTFAELAPYGWFAAAAAHFGAIGVAWIWPVAALLTGFMLAERLQRAFFRRLTGRPLDLAGDVEQRLALVAARRDTLLWTWLPFAAFGQWTAGLAVLAGYATASFFVAQWRSFVRLSAR